MVLDRQLPYDNAKYPASCIYYNADKCLHWSWYFHISSRFDYYYENWHIVYFLKYYSGLLSLKSNGHFLDSSTTIHVITSLILSYILIVGIGSKTKYRFSKHPEEKRLQMFGGLIFIMPRLNNQKWFDGWLKLSCGQHLNFNSYNFLLKRGSRL